MRRGRTVRAGLAGLAGLAGIAAGVAGAALLGGGGVLLAGAAGRVGSSQGYAPEQPIAFSHRLHAGTYRVACQYCHFAAERSRHAGIPPLSVCRNCHAHLRVASVEFQKLDEALAQGRAVSWVRVHNLPDFVAFRHDRHLLAGLACRECHGAVEAMARVRQVAPLSMGWCLDCHRRRAGAAGEGARVAARAHGAGRAPAPGLDCMRCHH